MLHAAIFPESPRRDFGGHPHAGTFLEFGEVLAKWRELPH
jgi:hypothetical protein